MALTEEQFRQQYTTAGQQAIAPAITGYEAQRPLIEERYRGVLSQIAGREEVEVGERQRSLSREYGRRGIPLSSGIFETTMGEKLAPIRRYYGEEMAARGRERTAEMSTIDQAIAMLRSQSAADAISQAMQAYQFQQQEQRLREQARTQYAGGGFDIEDVLRRLGFGVTPPATTAPTGTTFTPTPTRTAWEARRKQAWQPSIKAPTTTPRGRRDLRSYKFQERGMTRGEYERRYTRR